MDSLLERYKKLPLGNICDANGKIGCMSLSLKPVVPRIVMAGYAYPVKGHPGDNLAIHRAIYQATENSVLVVDVRGCRDAGHFGEIMATACLERGIAGLVINGTVRDAADLQKLGFPIFSLGFHSNGTIKESLGEINVPVLCGGVVVYPGDLVVGTQDGVAVIPRQKAEAVLERAEAIAEKEQRVVEQLRNGKSTLDIYGFSSLIKQKKQDL